MIWGYSSVNSGIVTNFSQILWDPTCWRAKCAVFFWTAWVPTLIRSRCERDISIAGGGWWFWSRDIEATEAYVVDMSEGPRTSWTFWHTLLCLEIWGSRTSGKLDGSWFLQVYTFVNTYRKILDVVNLGVPCWTRLHYHQYTQMDYFPVDDSMY